MIRAFSILFFFLLTGLLSSCAGIEVKSLCFQHACVRAEVAATQEARSKGLMFRKTLAEHDGMLFIFQDEDSYSFWMKNMNFPLDIIWVDKDKKIVDIKKNVPACLGPCQPLSPSAKARYVIEVSAGFTDRHSVSIGQEVRF